MKKRPGCRLLSSSRKQALDNLLVILAVMKLCQKRK